MREKKHIALSNSPVLSIEEHEEGRLFVFDESPLMSTYLLALIVGKFEFINGVSKAKKEKRKLGGEWEERKDVEIRIYAPEGRSHQGKYSLELAIQTLEFYEDFYGIPYPLKKLDLVSLHSK